MLEKEWMTRARSPMRPPLLWFTLRDMSDADLRALYRYIRSLGPKGGPAPAYVALGQAAMAPYFKLILPEGTAPQAKASPPIPGHQHERMAPARAGVWRGLLGFQGSGHS
jgi:hypothetical protein